MLIHDGVGEDKRFWPAFGITKTGMQRCALLNNLRQNNIHIYNNRDEASITIMVRHLQSTAVTISRQQQWTARDSTGQQGTTVGGVE